jgi:phosphoribosylformylglycinamidine cyclo-ligase
MPDKNGMEQNKGYSYKSAGVDIDKASDVLGQLKQTIASTFSKNVLSDLSSYSGLFKLDLGGYKNPVLASSTDGVGTKIMLAKRLNNYSNIGQDAVAMCINDIICCGAKPLFFLDYISCESINEEKIKAIIESISRSCSYCGAVLIGGETAEHPGTSGSDEIDIAGFVVGIVEKEAIINPSMVKEGDIVAGIPSSGIHSNGFSLVRKLIDDKNINPDRKYGWTGDMTLGDVLLTPTKLYSRIINKMIKGGISIHGIAHITGGGFYENINRVIPDDMDASMKEGSWSVPEIFGFLQEIGDIDEKEMFRVFNMGIGIVTIIPSGQFEKARSIAVEMEEELYNIGTIVRGEGKVTIKKD